MGKLRHRDFYHQSVAKPGTKSWAGVDALLGAGCNVAASQRGLSLRITQGKVAGRVIATVLEHPGCGYPSCLNGKEKLWIGSALSSSGHTMTHPRGKWGPAGLPWMLLGGCETLSAQQVCRDQTQACPYPLVALAVPCKASRVAHSAEHHSIKQQHLCGILCTCAGFNSSFM